MKKALILILSLCLVLSLLAGCGEKTPPQASDKPATTTPTEKPKTDIEGIGATGTEIEEAAAYEDEFIIGGQIQISSVDPRPILTPIMSPNWSSIP